MQLTPRLLWLLLATAVPLAGAWYLPSLVYVAGAWLVVLLAVVLADLKLSPSPGDWRLRRSHEQRLSLAAPNLITIAIMPSRLVRPVRLQVRDTPPDTFAIVEGSVLTATRAVPRQPTTVTYRVRPPRRGDYHFGDLYLRWESLLGLTRRQARLPAAGPVKVFPNLADVRKYDLLLRKNQLWELGLRNVRRFGQGSEFERLRDYLPDDEYRRIDWKATARRGKPIVAEFETERSQHIVALLDLGRMMRVPVGDVAKLDYAVNAVLLLTYVATGKGDRVGLLTFADQPRAWLAPRGGRGQFLRMLEMLYAVEGEPVEPDYPAALAAMATRQTRRGLVLVFTDLTGTFTPETLVAPLARLARHHVVLMVTMRDPTIEALARTPVEDSRSLHERMVAERWLEERRLTLERLRAAGVQTLDAPAHELSIALIDRYLEMKARGSI